MEYGVACPHLSVGVLHLKHGTVMRTVGFISENMSRHGELSSGCFHLMGDEGGEGDVAIDGSLLGSTQLDGNHLIGMRSKILFGVLDAVALVMNSSQGIVETQFAVIIRKLSLVAVFDVDHAQWLIELRVMALHIVLQGIGSLVILLEQRLSDFRNPLVGFATFVGIHGHARPEGDVVELDGVVVGSTVNQCTQFAIVARVIEAPYCSQSFS